MEEYTAFVGDIAPELTELELLQPFQARYATCYEAKIVKDFGFVRFRSEADRDRAISEMQGYVLANRPIRMRQATQRRAGGGGGGGGSDPGGMAQPMSAEGDHNNTTLFIGGLAPTVSEVELTNLFGRFGPTVYVRVPPNKGCGFVQFVDRQAAVTAMTTLQGHSLHGSQIRVSWGKNAGRGGSAAAPAAYAAAPHAAVHDAAAWAAQGQAAGWDAAWGHGDGYGYGYEHGGYGYGYEGGAWGAEAAPPEPQSTFGSADPRVVDVDAMNRRYMALHPPALRLGVGRLAFPRSQAAERADKRGLQGVIVSSA